MKSDRVKTGIKGFDALLKGGFPVGNTILVCGTPGTGKTLFSVEYIFHGAKDFKQKCMYVSFEQNEEDFRDQAKLLGWDLATLEKKGMLHLMFKSPSEITEKTVDLIIKEIKKHKIKRLVIDSISTLAINAPLHEKSAVALSKTVKNNVFYSPLVLGDLVIKRFIYDFISRLKYVDHCTTLLISEASEKGEYLSRDTISEFACDGIILFTFESMGGEFSRSLLIRKMRRAETDEDIHPLEISNKGIVVHTLK